MPACVTPRGTLHSPKGNLVRIREYVQFSSFLDHLFVRALLAKKLSTSTQKGSPEPVAMFQLDPSTVARVACSQRFFLFPAGLDKTICRVSQYESYLVRTYRTGKILSVSVSRSRAHGPGHTPQVDNRTCREHDVTTLPSISVSRQHRACVTRPSALYCCGYSSCAHRSLRSVIHLCPCLCCCCV